MTGITNDRATLTSAAASGASACSTAVDDNSSTCGIRRLLHLQQTKVAANYNILLSNSFNVWYFSGHTTLLHLAVSICFHIHRTDKHEKETRIQSIWVAECAKFYKTLTNKRYSCSTTNRRGSSEVNESTPAAAKRRTAASVLTVQRPNLKPAS